MEGLGTTPASAAGSYNPALTGVRALAALWVVGFHLDALLTTLFPALTPLRPWLQSGFLGVDFFFVLSGYVISHGFAHALAAEGARVGDFLRRRVARIYPLHLCVLLSLVAASSAARALGFTRFADSPMWRWEQLPAQLLMLHGWGLGAPAWNVPSWSASSELFGYLLFPFLAPALVRLRSRAVALALAALSLGLHLFVVERFAGGSLDRTYDGGLLRLVLCFVAGCALWRAQWPAQPRASARWLLACALVVVVSLARGPSPLAVLALALAVPSAAGADGALARLLASPLAQRWGRRSYALYLTHGIVVLVFVSLWPVESAVDAGFAVRMAYLGALLALVALVAAGAHDFVEEPLRRFLSRPRWRPRAEMVLARVAP